jgi:translation initiation factor 3 subunit F
LDGSKLVCSAAEQMVASLLLPISGSNINVKVHPVVLLQICDSYIRRGEKQDRVIGSLLGTVSDGTVNVSRCFVVPHTETMDQVSNTYAVLVTLYASEDKGACHPCQPCSSTLPLVAATC